MHHYTALTKLTTASLAAQESVLEVEYILAVTPPKQDKQLPHDDW